MPEAKKRPAKTKSPKRPAASANRSARPQRLSPRKRQAIAKTESWTANGHLHHRPLGSFEGIVGASFQRSALDRFGEETLVPAHESWAYGVYGYEQLEIGRWHLSFGARADRRVLDVEETDELAVEAQRRAWNSFTGNAGAVYRLAEPVSLVLNLGRGYRAPSAFDLTGTSAAPAST